MKSIRRHLEVITLQTKQPMALVILQELYGMSMKEIGDYVGRGQSQVTRYRMGLTPIPPKVAARLYKLLVEAEKTAATLKVPSARGSNVLLEAIVGITARTLEDWEKEANLLRPSSASTSPR